MRLSKLNNDIIEAIKNHLKGFGLDYCKEIDFFYKGEEIGVIKFKADFEFDNFHEEAFEDECEITIYDICVKNFYNINGIPLTNIMDYLNKNFKDEYKIN